MQCFFQLFDDNGAAQLKGSSKFKDHIGWLPLLAWNAGDQRPISPTTGALGASTRGKEIHIVLRSEDPVATTLANAAADGRHWSKGTLDCFKDGEDQAWYLRLTLQDPMVVSFQAGYGVDPGTGVTEATMSGTASSIDYRDAASKVTYLMPSGAIWDPDQEVCRVFDPDDPVSRSPQ